jgi:hypothetical protein
VLQRKVTHTVLRLLNHNLVLSRQADFPIECTSKTLTTMGFPCSDYLRQQQAAGELLPLAELH